MENYKGNVSASGTVLGSLIAQGGPQGKTGKEGYTPIKGVDYYTEAEKQEIVQDITQEVEGKLEPLEEVRQLNEQERIANENTRVEKEIERQNAETNRVSNEELRQQNETVRETQESEREESENRRIDTFSQMQKDVESAIKNIEDMTDAYNRNATEKTNDFNNNVTSKSEIFDANAADKTTAFNENAQFKIDEFNANAAVLENRVSSLEIDNTDNKQNILNIKEEQNTQNTKLNDLENNNAEQDEEITNIKTEQENQNNRLNDIEGKNTTQDEKIQELQNNVTNLESDNTTNKADISNIKTEQETQNNKLTAIEEKDISQDELIEELQNQIVELETENENIKNQIPTGEASGENITLNDSSDMVFKEFKVGGNSIQDGTPTPETPIEIRNVGDNVNEFDVSKIELNKTWNNTKSDGRAINFIEVKPNTTYTISCKDWKDLYCDLVCLTEKGASAYEKETGWFNSNTYTITTTENTKVLGVHFKYTSVGNIVMTEDMFKDVKIKLEKGKATPYSPYNCGSANITVCNENLFTGWIKGKGLNGTTGAEVTSLSQSVSDFIYVDFDKNPNYYLSGLTNQLTSFIAAYNSNKEFLGRSAWNAKTNVAINKTIFTYGTAQGTGDITYLRVLQAEAESTTGTIDDIDNLEIQLEEGSTETDYIEHQFQAFTFPLSEGQRMYKDSYLADDGVHHKRGQRIFDGTETDWTIRNDISNENFIVFRQNKYVAGSGLVTNSDGHCSHFRVMKSSNVTSNNVRFLNTNQYGICFTVSTQIVTTVAEWKTWLAEQYANGTPVTVEYELAEEVIEPYTEEQQLVYNEIKKAHSYKNVTHIFSTDETSPVFEVTYRKDLETLESNKEERLLALENAVLGGN